MKKARIAKSAGWVSIIGNIFLFVIKLWIGLMSSSVALISDAVHTLSDSISSVVVLIAIRISNKPADKEHPFGHGRADLIASIIVGVMLSIIAFEFLYQSIEILINHKHTNFGFWAIMVTLFSVLFKEGLAQYSLWAFRKTGFRTIKSDAWHHRSDALSSFIILVGIFFNSYFWWMDGALGIIVSLLIAYTAYEIIKLPIQMLLGESADENLVKKLNSEAFLLLGFDPKLHEFKIHRYGNHIEMTCHIKLDSETSFLKAHDVATLLENLFLLKHDISSTIHYEPVGYENGSRTEYFKKLNKKIAELSV